MSREGPGKHIELMNIVMEGKQIEGNDKRETKVRSVQIRRGHDTLLVRPWVPDKPPATRESATSLSRTGMWNVLLVGVI